MENLLDQLINHNCPSIEYRTRKEILNEYLSDNEVNEYQHKILSSSKISQILEWQNDDGYFGTRLHTAPTGSKIWPHEGCVWSLLLAGGYLKVISVDASHIGDSLEEEQYELALTNHEVRRMFAKMIRGWFKNTAEVYNEFIKALLNDDVKRMNIFMNRVALNTFSSFDSGNKPSEAAEPERFYHGFVLGMVVDLADRYKVKSNRESGYGRYDVMIEPLDRKGKAFLFEFKVLDRDSDEVSLEDTAANALAQLEEKRYEDELIGDGITPENIRKYGLAFAGKRCQIAEAGKETIGRKA